MFRTAIVLFATMATVFTFNSTRPVDSDIAIDATEITFGAVQVTIDVEETGTHIRTNDTHEGVIEVYNKATGVTNTAIIFRDDEAVYING